MSRMSIEGRALEKIGFRGVGTIGFLLHRNDEILFIERNRYEEDLVRCTTLPD